MWLVEVIPAMTDDDKAEDPAFFNPRVAFRFPMVLVAGNRVSVEAARRRNPELAKELAKGTVMLDNGDATALVQLAREVSTLAGAAHFHSGEGTGGPFVTRRSSRCALPTRYQIQRFSRGTRLTKAVLGGNDARVSPWSGRVSDCARARTVNAT